MPNGFKVCFAQQVLDILLTASKKVVQADDLQKQVLGCLLQGKQVKRNVTEEKEMTVVYIRDLLVQPGTCTSDCLRSPLLRSRAPYSFQCVA